MVWVMTLFRTLEMRNLVMFRILISSIMNTRGPVVFPIDIRPRIQL